MSSRRKCGQYPAAAGRDPYCPVCDYLARTRWPDDDDDQAQLCLYRMERTTRLHRAYRARR